MKFLKNIALVITILVIISCKKDDGLTKETQSGANTFSCKINGKVFLPKEELFSGRTLYANIKTINGIKILIVGASNATNKLDVSLKIENFTGVGTYQLSTSQSIFADYEIRNPVPNEIKYTTRNSDIGKINITRSDNNIVSGTFEFTCINEKDNADRVVFTKGRFDLVVD
ncbi:MAG: DUF6252 family protein [Daejeonella sp.]